MGTEMTTTERKVARVFAEVLEIPTISTDSDFFELGGDSHVAVNLAIALEDQFPIELPIELVEEVSTVRELAAWIDAQLAEGGGVAI